MRDNFDLQGSDLMMSNKESLNILQNFVILYVFCSGKNTESKFPCILMLKVIQDLNAMLIMRKRCIQIA